MKPSIALALGVWLLSVGARVQPASEPGLLFYLSADRGLIADQAAPGTSAPNFASDVRVVPNGAKGPALECGDGQLLSYRAPGNIYAARGTLSFFCGRASRSGPRRFRSSASATPTIPVGTWCGCASTTTARTASMRL